MPESASQDHRSLVTDCDSDEDLPQKIAGLVAAIEAIPAGFSLFDANDRLVLCNERYKQTYPRHADALIIGERFEDMLRAGVERGEFADAIGREEDWIAERLQRHANPSGPTEQRLSSGNWLQIEERRTADGGVVGLRTDITNLKAMEQALKQSEERFRDFAEASADWVWEMNADLRFTYMSGNVERIVGVPPEWHYGKSREDLLGDDYDREVWDAHLETLRNHLPFRNFEYRRVGEGIEPRWLRSSGIPIFAEDGSFRGYRGTGSDITEIKRAEERLHASEIKFLHAQKVESIGRLTGGVAHDFNNLLAVIQGNLELIAEEIDEPGLSPMISAALRSVERGARLTGQLLMFGRRTLLAPEVVDVNKTIDAMHDLIRRTVPASIDLEKHLAPGIRLAELDQSQLEAAVLNIVINAKDAMPDGGRLSIRSANLEVGEEAPERSAEDLAPGEYVLIAFCDNGHGMDAWTLGQAFEPFFTTKPVGEGSGLGLSMVHGFAQHSGGAITIESEPGTGTTVTLYFPVCEQLEASRHPAGPLPLPRSLRGETVLVAEDQEDVRRVVVAQLASLGYRTIEAEDGASALAMLTSDARIDLLLTDMVMPGSPQGPELAARACALRPGIPVILMTGYPSDGALAGNAHEREAVCLAKPISKGELAREIWKRLHGEYSG
jgi:PAS domain S-box-containing protein